MSAKLLFGLCVSQSFAIASAVKLSSYEHGAEFNKCIRTSDWRSKTIYDDITLVDRESGGCCPRASIPGEPYVKDWKLGPAVVCGFKGESDVEYINPGKDGYGVDASPGTINNCTYNRCFVNKRNVECDRGVSNLMSGCCDTRSCYRDHCGFKPGCRTNVYAYTDAYRGSGCYSCFSWDTMGSYKRGTSNTSDDWKNGKIVWDNFLQWQYCSALTCASSWYWWQRTGCDDMDIKEVCGHLCGTYLRDTVNLCRNETTMVNGVLLAIRDVAADKLETCSEKKSKCVMISRTLSEQINASSCASAN